MLLVRWAEGWIDVHALPPPAGRRREASLNIGNVATVTETIAGARRVLADLAGVTERYDVDLQPQTDASTPYIGWRPRPGAYVTVPGWDGTPAAQRVAAMTVTQDVDGNVTFAPELVDIHTDFAARTQRWLKRMANGSVGGRAEQASPERPPWRPSTPRRQPTVTFTLHLIDVLGTLIQIVPCTSGPMRPDTRGEVREWFCELAAAGSTSTTAELLVNGGVVASCTIPAGALSAFVRVSNVPLIPNHDVLKSRITAAGAGAKGFTGQARIDAII